MIPGSFNIYSRKVRGMEVRKSLKAYAVLTLHPPPVVSIVV